MELWRKLEERVNEIYGGKIENDREQEFSRFVEENKADLCKRLENIAHAISYFSERPAGKLNLNQSGDEAAVYGGALSKERMPSLVHFISARQADDADRTVLHFYLPFIRQAAEGLAYAGIPKIETEKYFRKEHAFSMLGRIFTGLAAGNDEMPIQDSAAAAIREAISAGKDDNDARRRAIVDFVSSNPSEKGKGYSMKLRSIFRNGREHIQYHIEFSTKYPDYAVGVAGGFSLTLQDYAQARGGIPPNWQIYRRKLREIKSREELVEIIGRNDGDKASYNVFMRGPIDPEERYSNRIYIQSFRTRKHKGVALIGSMHMFDYHIKTKRLTPKTLELIKGYFPPEFRQMKGKA